MLKQLLTATALLLTFGAANAQQPASGRELIRQAMERCNDVKIKAADFLGINRNTLTKKFAELGLNQPMEGGKP